jgi:hypothetical protein
MCSRDAASVTGPRSAKARQRGELSFSRDELKEQRFVVSVSIGDL